jgi:simple sugar transport system substrate-binding protein
VREAEATNALVDAGCDVITCHVDSPKVVIETAEKRGVKTCGHNASQAPLAPKGFITGAEYKWETIYKAYAANLGKGEPLPNFFTGGYHNDMVQNTAFGAGAGEAARKAATEAIADLKAGKPIYVGPLKDNKGKVVIDKTYDNYDPYLDGMSYLLEGVVGSIT